MTQITRDGAAFEPDLVARLPDDRVLLEPDRGGEHLHGRH